MNAGDVRGLRRGFAVLLGVTGVICILIALSHIVIGQRVIPGSIPTNATMDSEDRFYATLFLGWGAALVWSSLAVERRGALIRGLLLVFFFGGIARVISAVAVGLPVPLFWFLEHRPTKRDHPSDKDARKNKG